MRPGAVSYDNAVASVAALRKAGVKLAVGTDANAGAGSINRVAHGTSLHDELELLVEAGLSPAEAIAAATRHPASIFGLPNRGSVTAGFRADFLLLQGDPTQSIGVIRNSRRIFLAGIEQKLEN